MARYDFWVHGVGTIAEHPQRAQRILHYGQGTYVEQQAGEEGRDTENWFHLPIPTPTVLDGNGRVVLKYIRLRAKVNENARIAQLHIRDGAALIHDQTVTWTDRSVDERIDGPDREIEGGVALCVRVEFLTGEPVGSVFFLGAGGRFDS